MTKFIKFGLYAIIGLLSLSNCATLLAPKTTPVVLVDAPSDLVVKNGLTTLPIESVLSSVSGRLDNSTVSYFASGVKLKKKPGKQTLTLESGGQSKEVVIKMGPDGNWIFIDLFGGGPLAWVIDGVTGKWNKAKNKFVDVPAVLNGNKARSQGKLKRTIKREANGK
jgi:hypothetical protein